MRSSAAGGAVRQVRAVVRGVLADLGNGETTAPAGEAVQRLRGVLAVASATGELCTIDAAARLIRAAGQHLAVGEIDQAREALLLAGRRIPEPTYSEDGRGRPVEQPRAAPHRGLRRDRTDEHVAGGHGDRVAQLDRSAKPARRGGN